MYARVTSLQARRERIPEFIEQLDTALSTVLRQQPGSLGSFGLVDPSTGKSMTISFWDSPQDVEAFEMSGVLRRQLAEAAPLLDGPVIHETYQVTARNDPPPETPGAGDGASR